MRAYLRLPRLHSGRWESFSAGLRKAGFEVSERDFAPMPDDVLLIWNRMPRDEAIALRYQRVAAKIIVAENGYIGASADGRKLIALARTYHNGAGQWPQGDDSDDSRWTAMQVSLLPWRTCGDTILVLPQRGFGSPRVAMPPDWLGRVVPILRRMTKRSVIIRQHPGMKGPHEPNFTNVWAAVTWGSGAGIKAIASGIPVFHDFSHWIGAGAALPFIGADLEKPFIGDRLPMFRRLAWAQWSLQEIETGEPFRELVAL